MSGNGNIGNLGAANLLKNKADQSRQVGSVVSGLGDAMLGLKERYDALSQDFIALSKRNERLEWLIKSMTEKGVASEALGAIHAMKAEALQKQADKEAWPVGKRREANLKLAAEAEFDYRLKNDPSYRLNSAADALMKMANYSDCADQIRAVVAKMYATGKVRKDGEKDRMIAERIAEMKATARYESDMATVPIPDSIPPARLENHENDPNKRDTFSEVRLSADYPAAWVKPPSR